MLIFRNIFHLKNYSISCKETKESNFISIKIAMNKEEHGHKWAVLRQNTYCLKKSEFIYQSRGIFAPATASLRLCKKRGVSQFGNPQPLPSCGFAGAQPRLTQNAAPLAFCRLCRRSLSVQWPLRAAPYPLPPGKKSFFCIYL